MDDNHFFSIDRLVEFGLGMGMAQQMIRVMNVLVIHNFSKLHQYNLNLYHIKEDLHYLLKIQIFCPYYHHL